MFLLSLCVVVCSADAGWDDLKGYDMATGESNVLTQFVGGGNDVFVVQVQKTCVVVRNLQFYDETYMFPSRIFILFSFNCSCSFQYRGLPSPPPPPPTYLIKYNFQTLTLVTLLSMCLTQSSHAHYMYTFTHIETETRAQAKSTYENMIQIFRV